ncbi:MAG: deacetylase [Alteromonadaceae bacterium]|nr:MAG: deacetylase [Alteromonadaceae bacterium]
MPAAIISPAACEQHLVPQGHPERPKRLSCVNDQLLSSGLNLAIDMLDTEAASDEQLLRAHSQAHLDKLNQLDEQLQQYGSQPIMSYDGETFLSPKSLNAAKLAAGAVVTAVDKILAKKYRSIFCHVRPPGHHAERDRAMGFCLFNNIAIGALHALEAHGLKRVAIVDFDVHHGNGTQDIFLDDPRVLFCSAFQHPFYPYTPTDVDRAHILNLPLASGCRGDEFRENIHDTWWQKIRAHKPQLIFISAGFDGHADDDMSGWLLNDSDYDWISQQLRQLSDEIPQCKGIISALEGGYELPSLARCTVAHIKAIANLSGF